MTHIYVVSRNGNFTSRAFSTREGADKYAELARDSLSTMRVDMLILDPTLPTISGDLGLYYVSLPLREADAAFVQFIDPLIAPVPAWVTLNIDQGTWKRDMASNVDPPNPRWDIYVLSRNHRDAEAKATQLRQENLIANGGIRFED